MMNQDLMNLRKRMIGTSIKFTQAQRALLQAAAPNARRSETELKEVAEEYLKAAETYGAALQELREYLLAAAASEAVAVELGHTEKLIDALDKEKKAGLKLATHRLYKKSKLGGIDES
jgi:ABC-type methionine transport system permease subunit